MHPGNSGNLWLYEHAYLPQISEVQHTAKTGKKGENARGDDNLSSPSFLSARIAKNLFRKEVESDGRDNKAFII